jgi:hypothetical protein
MKKEILYYSTLLIVISSLLFFETNLFHRGSQSYSKIIDVETFDKLDIDLACNIYVSIGDEQKIVFEGPKKYINLVEATLENGILKITSKKGGILDELFGSSDRNAKALNLYINLTDTSQLLTPKKGNLISNETFIYLELEHNEKSGPNESLRRIFKILGSQFGFIQLS